MHIDVTPKLLRQRLKSDMLMCPSSPNIVAGTPAAIASAGVPQRKTRRSSDSKLWLVALEIVETRMPRRVSFGTRVDPPKMGMCRAEKIT